jgi:hypothetical protein
MSHMLPGNEIHCPHCDQWHTLFQPYPNATTAEKNHLFFRCLQRKQPGPPAVYFAGIIGEASARHSVRERSMA